MIQMYKIIPNTGTFSMHILNHSRPDSMQNSPFVNKVSEKYYKHNRCSFSGSSLKCNGQDNFESIPTHGGLSE